MQPQEAKKPTDRSPWGCKDSEETEFNPLRLPRGRDTKATKIVKWASPQAGPSKLVPAEDSYDGTLDSGSSI